MKQNIAYIDIQTQRNLEQFPEKKPWKTAQVMYILSIGKNCTNNKLNT